MEVKEEIINGAHSPAASLIYHSKKLEDDVRMLGLRIKQHEENINFMKSLRNKLDDSILDGQVSLGKCYSASAPKMEHEDPYPGQNEEETTESILRLSDNAASIFCQLKLHHESHASNLPWIKDVHGIVATLGKIEDDNLSRLLAEYLGKETMLAVVCKTLDCVKAIETYSSEGFINKSSGLHGLGTSLGRPLNGRFAAICLANLRPYAGDFIANDPQRRLDILKPKLPNGETPSGFLGFAVNMIKIDHTNLNFVTADGYGLRETLFYYLFSSLQVYQTRDDMYQALPLISNGAISLDGGVIRNKSVFLLGNREEVVKFPKASGRSIPPENYFEAEGVLKETRWRKERLLEDMRREQTLLDQAKFDYEIKKQQLVKFLAESSLYTNQVHYRHHAER